MNRTPAIHPHLNPPPPSFRGRKFLGLSINAGKGIRRVDSRFHRNNRGSVSVGI